MSADLNRREGETDLAYHRRLIEGKLRDRTIDADYTELAPLVYGQDYSSDVARRMMYGSAKTLRIIDAEQENNTRSSGYTDELEEKMIEMRKERQRLSDQRREYAKMVSSSARFEHLADRLVEVADNLNDTLDLSLSDDFVPPAECDDGEAVLVFCDWHYGMTTNNIWNKYDTEVCKRRVEKIAEMAAERLVLHKPRVLHILVLGDMIHGAIHTSARVASEELVCDQIMHVSEILAQSIAYLSAFVPNIYVHCTYGNHARTIQSKEDSIHRDNLERLIPWWISQRLSGVDYIHVTDESEYELLYLNVAGYGVCASHGDIDSVRDTSSLNVVMRKAAGVDVNYVLLADKHHHESFERNGVTGTIVGSLCGADDYANNKRLFSTPEQLLLFFKTDYGLDASYRLRCP